MSQSNQFVTCEKNCCWPGLSALTTILSIKTSFDPNFVMDYLSNYHLDSYRCKLFITEQVDIPYKVIIETNMDLDL